MQKLPNTRGLGSPQPDRIPLSGSFPMGHLWGGCSWWQVLSRSGWDWGHWLDWEDQWLYWWWHWVYCWQPHPLCGQGQGQRQDGAVGKQGQDT